MQNPDALSKTKIAVIVTNVPAPVPSAPNSPPVSPNRNPSTIPVASPIVQPSIPPAGPPTTTEGDASGVDDVKNVFKERAQQRAKARDARTKENPGPGALM